MILTIAMYILASLAPASEEQQPIELQFGAFEKNQQQLPTAIELQP